MERALFIAQRDSDETQSLLRAVGDFAERLIIEFDGPVTRVVRDER